MQNSVRTVMGEGARELVGFELILRGAQRLAVFTCLGCLGESGAGGMDIRAPRCSQPHTCALSRFGRVSVFLSFFGDCWLMLNSSGPFAWKQLYLAFPRFF